MSSGDLRADGAERKKLTRWHSELDARNADNVTRTASYLELYAHTREHPPDLPWLLMAHLVSRNGGYMMSDVAEGLTDQGQVFTRESLLELFLLLERANFLIFYDAWHHVLMHLLGRAAELSPPRTPVFVCDAWRRYGRGVEAGDAHETEARLVADLVTNEQHFIEERVVRNPRFAGAMAIVGYLEAVRRDAALVLPLTDARIRVGRFGDVERRIATGIRIWDEVLADSPRRESIFRWALAHPHTGSRAVYGGHAGPTVSLAWPKERMTSSWTEVHAPPEPDPSW